MHCSKCGKEIEDGKKICDECKSKLLDEIQEEAEQLVEEPKKEEEKKVEKVLEQIEEQMEKTEEKNETNINKNKKLIWITCIVTIAVLAVGIGILSYFYLSEYKETGNTIGNIRNYGYSVFDGKDIFYMAPALDSGKIGIYHLKNGETEGKLLIEDNWNIVSLNEYQNYLYFITIKSNSTESPDNKIYRMKKDGSSVEVINDNEFSDTCYEIYVVKGKVFYINSEGNTCSMSLNGDNKKVVYNGTTGYIGITDKYIFVNEFDENQKYVTYRLNLDGTNKIGINGGKVLSLNVYGDMIYYTNEESKICSMNMKDMKENIISETAAYYMNQNGDYLYYMDYVDEEQISEEDFGYKNTGYVVGIYKIKTDGSEKTLITKLDSYSSFINVLDDKVFYMDSNDKIGSISFIDSDGNNRNPVYQVSLQLSQGTTDETKE